MRGFGASVPILVGVLLFAGAAMAQPSDAEREALRLYDEGYTAYDAGDFATARDRFRAALERFPHPRAMLSLGLAAERLGDAAEAVRWLERYLASGDVPEDEAALRARIERLRRTPVEVRVISSPLGARILVDGESTPSAATPARLSLTPGHHVLRLMAEGHESLDHGVEVELGAAPPIEVTLTPLPARLIARGVGRVRVDDQEVGDAPWEGEVEPGEHRVQVGRGATLTVTATRGATIAIASEGSASDTEEPAIALEVEVMGTFGAIPTGEAGAAPGIALGGRAGVGARFGGAFGAILALEGALLGSTDAQPAWLGAAQFRGGADANIAGPLSIRASAALGLAITAIPVGSTCAGSLSARDIPWIPRPSVPCTAPQLGISTGFELAFALRFDPIEVVIAPVALQLWVLNPLAIIVISPSIGVRFR